MRSFGNENILELLHKNRDKLLRYGGHSQAAGLQIEESKIEALREGLNSIGGKETVPLLKIDMELDLCQINIDTIQFIQDRSFFTASFLFRDLTIIQKQILSGKHTKLVLECHGKRFDALHFNSLEYFYSLERGDRIDVVAGLVINNYRNNKKIQLMIKDIECKDFQILNLRDSDSCKKQIKWIINDYIEINDLILLEKDLKKVLKENSQKQTILITPKKLHLDFKKFTSKRELGKIYQMLKDIKEFKLDLLLKRMEYNPYLLKYSVQIFKELGFIEKTRNSSTYVTLEEIKKIHDLIYYDYYSHIKTYFKNLMEEL